MKGVVQTVGDDGRDTSPFCGMALAVGGALMVVTTLGQPHQSGGLHLAGVLGGAAFIMWGAWQAGALRLSQRRLTALRQALSRSAGRLSAVRLRRHRAAAARRPSASGQPGLAVTATPHT
jgi:hypothetical protein